MKRRKAFRVSRPLYHPGRKALAYHEAGHAVAGYVLGLEVEHLTIIPDETSLGRCRYRDWDSWDGLDDLDRLLILILAGAVAEEIATGAPSRGLDEPNALALARSRCDSEAEAAERVAAARSHIRRFLECHWPAVKTLAMALRKERQLDGPGVMATLRRAFRGIGASPLRRKSLPDHLACAQRVTVTG